VSAVDGAGTETLHDEEGGSADNLVETYTLSGTELGGSRNGTYTLKVTDTAAEDVGQLKSWKLVF
jgi:subtilisin-like proprotein convertase family protein